MYNKLRGSVIIITGFSKDMSCMIILAKEIASVGFWKTVGNWIVDNSVKIVLSIGMNLIFPGVG